MTFLIAIMSFANFVFYPLVIGTIIAVIIEQIFRARGDEDNPEDIKKVVQLNLDMGGKESDGKFYEPYYAWESIRSVMRNQPNNPIRVGGTI